MKSKLCLLSLLATISLSVNSSAQESAATKHAKSSGTGFAITPDVLVTNHHVVAGCASIDVVSSQNRFPGRVVSSDEKVDLALLNVPGLSSSVAKLRRSSLVRLGEPVMVFGFPLTGALSSAGNFTSGLVSALQGLGDANGELQITAPVQPGNSGGPLMDASGLVIGVVQAKLDALRVSKATGDIPQNVNFALSLETLERFLRQRKVGYTDSNASGKLEVTSVAASAQTFTYRVECMLESSAQSAAKNEATRPAPPTKQAPTPAEIQASRDAARTALAVRAPPVPEFSDTESRLKYLKWLGRMSEKLKSVEPQSDARKELLQTVWYESRRAGIDPSLVLGLIETVSSFRKYYRSENGSMGYMSVGSYWARTLGNGDARVLLFNMQTNLRFGCVILRHYLDQRKGDLFLALTDYYESNVFITGRHQPESEFPNLVIRNKRHWD